MFKFHLIKYIFFFLLYYLIENISFITEIDNNIIYNITSPTIDNSFKNMLHI